VLEIFIEQNPNSYKNKKEVGERARHVSKNHDLKSMIFNV
jgi:hypothetical protein